MDISSLKGIQLNTVAPASSGAEAEGTRSPKADGDLFSTILDTAIDNINTTNSYLSDAENEEIKFALGETQNTHDLTIALQKASTALQYTVSVRDRMLEAYREIMQMQI